MMGIDRAGAPFVGGALVLAALAAWLGSGWWWAIPFVLLAAFLGFFFRDPDRVIGADALAVLSPADGRVMVAGPGRAVGRAPRATGSRSASSCRRWTSTSTASPTGAR